MKKYILFFIFTLSLIFTGCASKDKYTMQQFERLYLGISYGECQNILGSQGELMSENYIPGIPGYTDSIHTAAFSWKNKNGSNIFLIFQNSRLVQKSQYGLK